MQQSPSFAIEMDSNYPNDIQFAGLVEAATAAADAHQRDLGKRKRGEENAYTPVSSDVGPLEGPRAPTLSASASVLFREPSEKSKKYSRPPLGKVFTSLELAPEAFLRLQQAAKGYMLNDEFPERKDVVGHKKLSHNNDVAKLKLYECVEDFLQQENVGEQFFGHSSSEATADSQPRTFFWPEDRNRIVKLLMPLLRKMVTNERQRIYAAETRKQDPRKSEEKGNKIKTVPSHIREGAAATIELAPEIDPLLQDASKESSIGTELPIMATSSPHESDPVMLRVNILKSENGIQKRIVPELEVSSPDAPSIEQFYTELKMRYDELPQEFKVKVWLADGVSVIRNNEEWLSAQLKVTMHEWMDRQLKVLVEI